MILVVGGLASGKRTFARSLGFSEDRMTFDAHELVCDGRQCDELAVELLGKAVVTCAEVGSGIVPLDADQRVWRERVGRLCCTLAEHADAVVRMVCGVPVVLKGDIAASAACSQDFADGRQSPSAASVELILIRHGQTPGNGEKRYVGIVDQPLSEAGRAQARAAGVHDDVSRVYVSTLRRTHETAAIMFPRAEQVVVEGIQEMDFGVFAGRTPDEMTDDAQYRAWVDSGCVDPCPEGESQAQLTGRVCTAMEDLIRQASLRGERRIVVVGHGGTMMAFLSRYGGDPSRQYWEWLVGNCEGYHMSVSCIGGDVAVSSIERW